ncbi:polysaccharide biosynthesis tyrosine autokinase [Aetokthonos hydrillicola Thurmond2011]|jgi:capsular exopolysaccharide synthesis family protein|uniref:non-specific protein-tyrosine kinase n=1 Tax=Aetokthonos hydrillicola Thurmond2011 TaxID=2712845 RepID=A0AAP5I204_9CYAN|nr:polysaccharide biosynthesis tyrosine autokinase [Aetokthonos hydrillicola]MBO3462264.1 polysaccharide biosynthesis tyrosine autokinase [Aetokthonos hydrillicola CCALA 1050]MBW4589493.1 polysaccharide biosynthesis tyrosine autokinase [Aetokthonos hydrillicola CCALA 1050]MDR9893663.1 polysaccharide biosynthesis tyrosine autokinase [Aetokthonos hydrillicola Thurmond2011]
MNSPQSINFFNKLLLIVKRRWLPALVIFFPVLLISNFIFSFKRPYYISEGKLLFQRKKIISSLPDSPGEVSKLETVALDNGNPLNTEAEVLRSISLVKKTIDQLSLKQPDGTPLKTEDFLERLTVSDIEKTDILKVSYKDKNPETAAAVVNTLINFYLDYNVSSQRMEVAAARKFIEEQVPKAESVVSQAENELADFKEKNKIVSLSEEATKAVDIITDLQKQMSQVQSDIANANAQSLLLREDLSTNRKQAINKTSISQSSGVQDILKEVQQLESQLAAKRTLLQDTHPEIINLQNKLAALKDLLQRRIKQVAGTAQQPETNTNLQIGALQEQLSGDLFKLESSSIGLTSQYAALSSIQAKYKQRLNSLPRLEQQQRQLERKVQVAQSNYSLLLQKLQESRIAENQNIGNASLVSSAQVPQKPIASPIVSYLSASLLSTMAALATVLFLEATDKSIKTVDEAKQLTGLTLLGIIPSFNKPKRCGGHQQTELFNSGLVVRDTPRSAISEAFRMLRANLRFVNADKQVKVIVVTSSVPREGKSTVAANLAIAMAQTDRKVLLIDGDMYRPAQHQIWEVPNNQGLSNVIIGQTQLNNAVQQVMDNLDLLTSGFVPPSPASLLDSKRMAYLMETFVVNYDFIIIDTPALTVAADGAILGQMTDGVLFVVRPGVVDSVNARAACALLAKSRQNVLGQVVNGVIPKNEPHSYYYFTEEYEQDNTKLSRL